MGQAKARGTLEQRKEKAIVRNEAARIEKIKSDAQKQEALALARQKAKEEKAQIEAMVKEKKKSVVILSGNRLGRTYRKAYASMAILAATALANKLNN